MECYRQLGCAAAFNHVRGSLNIVCPEETMNASSSIILAEGGMEGNPIVSFTSVSESLIIRGEYTAFDSDSELQPTVPMSTNGA